MIERANNTNFGLAAGVVTNDVNNALTFANAVEAGSVWVNCYDAVVPQAPFGGFKQSGAGRELYVLIHQLHAIYNLKQLIVFNSNILGAKIHWNFIWKRKRFPLNCQQRTKYTSINFYVLTISFMFC